MAEIIAAPVAEIVVENLFDRIGRHVGYMWNYSKNILDVSQQIEKLRDGRLRVQQSVDEANRQGDEIFPDVQKWLSRAEEMIKETDKFIEDEKEANRGCFHLKMRYQRSKKAKNQAADIITKIQEADKYGVVAHRPPPPPIASSSISGSQVFESRETTLNQIMEALRDDGIRMIGVWGMGGVGKTTLVQQLAIRAQAARQSNEEKLFDTVVMALNISQTPNVTKIQGEIASILGLKLEGSGESERALRLNQSLKKHGKILVILDDIWEPIAFERIGIPYKSQDHPMGQYCKVLLTSREHDLLSKDMGTDKDFHVQHMSQEEAWSLFKQTAGDFMKNPELQPIATEVVKECEGLPVAIVTLAKSLKGESVGVWRNALEELRRSAPTNIRGVSKNVYSCLELSYNHLESEEVKLVFILCGLLGDEGDISLDDLLKYMMGLNLFDYLDSLEKARDKVVTLVKILKASSLLLDVVEAHRQRTSSYFMEEEGKGYVRMHDIIRDVAKSIVSKDPHRLVVNEDVSSQDWKKRGGESEMLVCKSAKKLPEGLVCPKLEFFFLDNGYPSSDIPDTIFEGMKEVRVVCLSRVFLSGRLPSSLKLLSNLRTLCLHIAYRLQGLGIIGELKKLQILSIVHCDIGELPESMKGLSDLRMLSLRYCETFIPRNLISSLSRLEHLSLRQIFSSFEEWTGVEDGERMAWLSELKHLSCLKALEVEIPSPCLLPKDVHFNNLARYDIFIGYQKKHNDVNVRSRNTSRGVKLYNFKGPPLVKCFSKLFKTVEVLDLKSSWDDIKHFVHELDCDGFPHLKYLSINHSYALHYIMNTKEMEMEMEYCIAHAFPLLEELHLIENYQLEAVCHGPIPIGCFANLRVLRIEGCWSLKYVLWQPTAQGRESILEFPQLQQLELLRLSDEVECFYSTGINRSTQERPLIIPFFNQIALPRLEQLSLVSSWPRMYTVEGMYNVGSMWDNQYPVYLCCKLKKVALSGCKNLQTVFPSNFLEEGLQSLEFLSIGHCPSLKEIFEIDRSVAVINKKHHLQGYPAFQNLKSLMVYCCRSLKYLFLTSMVKGLVQLGVLEISYCPVEKIVVNIDQNENETETEAEAVAPMSLIFPRLTSLKLSGLWKLKRFYEQEKYVLGCPLLKKLEVYNCDNVELLFQGESIQDEEVDHKQPLFFVNKNTFPNVEELKLSWGSMEIWGGQFSRESFGKLRNLEIEDRHNISVVIPSSKLRVLHNLQLLTLRRCDSVKAIIQMEELTVGETETVVVLPQLAEMLLEDLPMLRHLFRFRFQFGLWPVPQKKSSGKLQALHNLKKLTLRRCNSVEKVIQVDDDHEQGRRLVTQLLQGQAGETQTVVLLPHLTEMHLEDLRLPMLTPIYLGLVLLDLD